jgi:hypothetical protein
MYFVWKNYFVGKFDIILEESSVAIFPISHSPHLENSSFHISGASEFALCLTSLEERDHPNSETVR